MALIVEDGTGLEDADSYASVEDFDAYLEAFGYVFEGDSEEIALRRATRLLDVLYTFNGVPLVEEQALHWPTEDFEYVPRAVKEATMELALLLADGTFDPLSPIDTAEYGLTEYTIEGAGIGRETKKWADGNGTLSPQVSRLRKIDYLLAGYFAVPEPSDWYQMEVERG